MKPLVFHKASRFGDFVRAALHLHRDALAYKVNSLLLMWHSSQSQISTGANVASNFTPKHAQSWLGNGFRGLPDLWCWKMKKWVQMQREFILTNTINSNYKAKSLSEKTHKVK